MNLKKAKALRKGLGYHPAHPREYEADAPNYRQAIGMDGKKQLKVTPGTIRSTGLRRQYQTVKRNAALAAAVTGAR